MMQASILNCSSSIYGGWLFVYSGFWGDPNAKCSLLAINSVRDAARTLPKAQSAVRGTFKPPEQHVLILAPPRCRARKIALRIGLAGAL